jgi:hypothetical protein
MSLSSDEFDRLDRLRYRPISTRHSPGGEERTDHLPIGGVPADEEHFSGESGHGKRDPQVSMKRERYHAHLVIRSVSCASHLILAHAPGLGPSEIQPYRSRGCAVGGQEARSYNRRQAVDGVHFHARGWSESHQGVERIAPAPGQFFPIRARISRLVLFGGLARGLL